jgi:hypothetical protein
VVLLLASNQTAANRGQLGGSTAARGFPVGPSSGLIRHLRITQRSPNQAAAVPLNMSSRSAGENPATIS